MNEHLERRENEAMIPRCGYQGRQHPNSRRPRILQTEFANVNMCIVSCQTSAKYNCSGNIINRGQPYDHIIMPRSSIFICLITADAHMGNPGDKKRHSKFTYAP